MLAFFSTKKAHRHQKDEGHLVVPPYFLHVKNIQLNKDNGPTGIDYFRSSMLARKVTFRNVF